MNCPPAGVAAEEECNFLSILACTTSGLADYTYSGWLFGYIHLSNALYRADPEAWQAIRDTLPETVPGGYCRQQRLLEQI